MTARRLGLAALCYVGSVVFSFGAMNAAIRKGPENYKDRLSSIGTLSLIPGINLFWGVGATGFLADGWTWDRSDPTQKAEASIPPYSGCWMWPDEVGKWQQYTCHAQPDPNATWRKCTLGTRNLKTDEVLLNCPPEAPR